MKTDGKVKAIFIVFVVVLFVAGFSYGSSTTVNAADTATAKAKNAEPLRCRVVSPN